MIVDNAQHACAERSIGRNVAELTVICGRGREDCAGRNVWPCDDKPRRIALCQREAHEGVASLGEFDEQLVIGERHPVIEWLGRMPGFDRDHVRGHQQARGDFAGDRLLERRHHGGGIDAERDLIAGGAAALPVDVARRQVVSLLGEDLRGDAIRPMEVSSSVVMVETVACRALLGRRQRRAFAMAVISIARSALAIRPGATSEAALR